MDTLFPRKRMSKISLVGLGRSNTPLIPFLLSRGFSVEVFDPRPPSSLPKEARALLSACRSERLSLFFEDHRPFTGDIVLRSPGIRPDGDARFREAARRGACITTEAGLFLRHAPTPVLAVTGSDGKSTTAVITSQILKAGGYRVFLGGNIGRPLLPSLGEAACDYTVAELSSLQLYDAGASPAACLLTNLTENHLNWHKDLSEYEAAKDAGLRHARRRALPADPPMCEGFRARYPSAPLFSLLYGQTELFRRFGARECLTVEDGIAVHSTKSGHRTELFSIAALPLVGQHNLLNFMAAALLLYPFVSPSAIQAAAASVRPLPHRIEFIAAKDGARFYNSSIDSSPSRTAATLAAFPSRVILLLGGKGKGLSYAALPPLLAEKTKAVFLSGQNREELYAALTESPVFRESHIPLFSAECLEDAIKAAAGLAAHGDTVLLSPAATAFDAYPDYAARGESFRRCVCHICGIPYPEKAPTELDFM